jgi:hypothetical protein
MKCLREPLGRPDTHAFRVFRVITPFHHFTCNRGNQRGRDTMHFLSIAKSTDQLAGNPEISLARRLRIRRHSPPITQDPPSRVLSLEHEGPCPMLLEGLAMRQPGPGRRQ